MTDWDYDIIVLGACAAGACSAIALAQEGYRVFLLDPDVFPRHKPRGEGITKKERLALAKG